MFTTKSGRHKQQDIDLYVFMEAEKEKKKRERKKIRQIHLPMERMAYTHTLTLMHGIQHIYQTVRIIQA